MNKAELISAIAEKAGLTKVDAGKALEAMMDTTIKTLMYASEGHPFLTEIQTFYEKKWLEQGSLISYIRIEVDNRR